MDEKAIMTTVENNQIEGPTREEIEEIISRATRTRGVTV